MRIPQTTTTRKKLQNAKKEAERQHGIRLKKKKETEKLKAFWAYAQEKVPKFVGEFLVVYEHNSLSINHEDQVIEDQVIEDQETPKGTEDQETPQQSLGETLVNNEGCTQSNFGLFERLIFGLSK